MSQQLWKVGEFRVREPHVWVGVEAATGRLVVRVMEGNWVRDECVVDEGMSQAIAHAVLKSAPAKTDPQRAESAEKRRSTRER